MTTGGLTTQPEPWHKGSRRDSSADGITEYLPMVRNAVTTAIRIGAVCNAPTWVRNAASSTIENGAAASDPGTAASRQVNARPNGTAGNTSCTRTPAAPPMNNAGKIGPPMNPLAWHTANVNCLAITRTTSSPTPRLPAPSSTVLS